ncbi:alpha/beta hydrolase fold domain-containing protein [Altererythrobacter aerius]|uniref:Alpha/beta hydrolase fold domain-containing protein n=1 Tax=Tsuneonella aeria TaxID=1837929 RepID=A0A6I4TAK0_9SPHN|nr:alpha/beta hydrolase [Tsuneonella aeria]MXO74341.1 alpha/beta hydrolase fold domain-containing protein [Tsuneonella aeria]
MAIHPGFNPMLEAMAPFVSMDWATVPADQLRAFADNPMASGEPLAMARVENLTIPVEGASIPARLYVPEGAPDTPPLTMFFHGGGWVLGTLETHDATCRALARDAGCAVLSVGYRLAPEHRYPTAAEDCYAATLWATRNARELGVDGSRLAVAGDSAGGNLAAAVALMARDRRGPDIVHQLLIYPVVVRNFETPSYQANGGPGTFLPIAAMRRFWDDYLGDADTDTAELASLLTRDDLAGLPAATVVVAEHDPLHDEGVAYAGKLSDAGVAVTKIEAPGMIHGFFGMTDIVPDAREWTVAAARRLGEALA